MFGNEFVGSGGGTGAGKQSCQRLAGGLAAARIGKIMAAGKRGRAIKEFSGDILGVLL